MRTTNIILPSKGMVTNVAPTQLDPAASPYIFGCYVKQGEIRSQYGLINFPSPGNTQTNLLNGSVMAIESFTFSTGNEFLLALTTTHLYLYNNSTNTWDNVTMGATLDSCDSNWTASSNVTTTEQSTIMLRGTGAVKIDIASAFTTGIAAYHNFSAFDFTAHPNTYISLWLYPSINVANDVLRLRVSSQNAGGTGAVYADYTIPALTSGIWQHVALKVSTPVASSGGTYPNDLTAVLSVALVAHSDPGTLNIYVDDIRLNQTFTGTLDNRFSTGLIYDNILLTNGVDIPSNVINNSGAVHATLTLNLPQGGAITTSEIVKPFKDHVHWMNNTENGVACPIRDTWSNIGTINDLINGTAGFEDLTDEPSVIVASLILSENELAIYKENSICMAAWTGGHTPFRFDTVLLGNGALSKDSVVFVEGYHVVMDFQDIFVFNGSSDIQPIDETIQPYIYANLNLNYSDRTFLFYRPLTNEVTCWICYQQTTADQGFTFNDVDQTWYILNRNINCFGTYTSQSSITIGQLMGTIAQQNYTIGSTLLKSNNLIILCGDVNGKVYQVSQFATDNAGTPYTCYYDTPDYVQAPQTSLEPSTQQPFEDMMMRVNQLLFEAYGTSVTTLFSIDGGITWNPTQGNGQNVITLTNQYQMYQQDFETICNKIRFRFTGNGPFFIKYYGFKWQPRTDRL